MQCAVKSAQIVFMRRAHRWPNSWPTSASYEHGLSLHTIEFQTDVLRDTVLRRTPATRVCVGLLGWWYPIERVLAWLPGRLWRIMLRACLGPLFCCTPVSNGGGGGVRFSWWLVLQRSLS